VKFKIVKLVKISFVKCLQNSWFYISGSIVGREGTGGPQSDSDSKEGHPLTPGNLIDGGSS
jgi:hypothetical protein